MQVGDLVRRQHTTYTGWSEAGDLGIGIVVAELPGDYIEAPAVSVLWSSGELVERVPPRILEVISESR